MYKHVFIVISLSSLCLVLYGVISLLLQVEKNSCQMTYMFEYPQFVRVHFKENDRFAKYGLYAYSEGALTGKARAMQFTGAPVIFVPGNSGSYKQGRSLASIALRKGLNNDRNHHLDYFTIDYNEEYSALFGGYLDVQAEFLKSSVLAVLKLYEKLPNAPKQVILIGHSMGAKIAQAVMADKVVSKHINTVISLAGPVDRPVVNLDTYFEAFYRKTDSYLSVERTPFSLIGNSSEEESVPRYLDDKLLITIGGGNRDLLVHAGLTHSKYSDIHAMTSTIPGVWLSTDHLCTVWCRQLMLVVNRFLYSIITTGTERNGYKQGQFFIEDKSIRLAKANHYFVKSMNSGQNLEVRLVENIDTIGEWVEDSRRVFVKHLSPGINRNYYQMIRFADAPQYKVLSVEAVNIDSDDWVFGCAALDSHNNMRYCPRATSLSQYVNKVPSLDQKRFTLSIDLHQLHKENPSWTHVILRVTPTAAKVQLNVDINNKNDRTLEIKMPKWYSYRDTPLLDDTTLGSSHYRILVSELHESHQSIELTIKARVCSAKTHHAVAKISVPWAKGFDRYQHITHNESKSVFVNVPVNKPTNFNATGNEVAVDLHLDPNCRYVISYQNSFGGTLSRIVHQYFHWLPAHLTAILLLSFKYQVSLTPKMSDFKCGKLHSALLHSSSFFIITATRIFVKFLDSITQLPRPDEYRTSMLIPFIIHGSALALLLLSTAVLWLAICFNGNIVHKILWRLTKIRVPTLSALVPIFEKIPISAGVVLVSIALGSCGAVALLCACCIYFILISKQYEDYLEQFVFKTAKLIASKLFGKKEKSEKTEEKKEKPKAKPKCNHRSSNEPDTTEEEFGDSENEEEETENLEATEDNQLVAIDHNQEEEHLEEINEDREVVTTPEDEELERLLKEAIEQQKKLRQENEEKRKVERKEYDSVHEGLSSLHFHVTLFMLLCVVSLLNLPTAISWAKNFNYSRQLETDPSLIPAVLIIGCLSLLWQFSTPRNVYAYQFVSSALYVCAAISVMYCQDSVYRLNGVITAVFALVTVHQFASPTKPPQTDTDLTDVELQTRIDRMQAVLDDAAKTKPST